MNPHEKVTLRITVGGRGERFDSLMSQLLATRVPIISAEVSGFYLVVESVARRDTIATARCQRFTLPYLEDALRTQRFPYELDEAVVANTYVTEVSE
jgi:hypothetical protein